MVDKDREYLGQWLPWVSETNHPDDVAAFTRRCLEQFARNEGFHAGIWYEEKFAGCVGFKPIDWTNLKTEIGYWLASQFQGKGLMTDAVRMLTTHCFEEWKLNRVEIRVACGNERSAGVPRRLGYLHEGTLRQASRLHGQMVDLRVFSMLAQDWKA
jgi:ribosomal-protein-serine acetyltransferase